MSKPCVRTSALVAWVVAIAATGVLAACGGGARSHPGTAATPAQTHPRTTATRAQTDTTTTSAGAQTDAGAGAAGGHGQAGRRVVVTISSRRSGHSLPAGFVGLAMEDWTLTKNQFAHTNLRRYLLALGPRGLLRIGGNSLDRAFWTSRHERAPRWAHGTATPASLRSLAAVLHGTGWRVLLGVNLLHYDPARAVDEARSAAQILGPNLAAVEIGNEPDRYGVSEATFLREFQRYTRMLRTALPARVGLAGPETSSSGRRWLQTFARQQTRSHEITLLTSHNYPASACDGRRPTIAQLLSFPAEHSEQAAADASVAAGRLDRVPAAIDETNSAVCWGAPGTSDVFASALWSLDYTLLLAHAGLSSVEFQGRIAGCASYSPLCTGRHGAALFARPDFYGLLAVHQLPPGAFLQLTDPAAGTLRAYALTGAAGALSVVLDNLGGPVAVALHLPGPGYESASSTVLRTASVRGLAATREITLGGRRIGPGAAMAPPAYRPVGVRDGSVTLPIAAHTAVILRIQPASG
jgi:hypothetical protein